MYKYIDIYIYTCVSVYNICIYTHAVRSCSIHIKTSIGVEIQWGGNPWEGSLWKSNGVEIPWGGNPWVEIPGGGNPMGRKSHGTEIPGEGNLREIQGNSKEVSRMGRKSRGNPSGWTSHGQEIPWGGKSTEVELT